MEEHSEAADELIIYRHPLLVRAWHWINAVCFIILLMSGLQIFNAYPRLHWGNTGFYDMPAVFEIGGTQSIKHQKSWVKIGNVTIDTTGVLGVAREAPFNLGELNIAFPPWATLPQGVMDLHNGRGWHFLALYFFAFNLLIYQCYGFATGRFRRVLRPRKWQLRPKAILADLWMHVRLKHPTGLASLEYNLLQKCSYIGVLFGLLPAMVLTGMTMSPSALAVFPWLIDLFDGRQSARTIHFICAMLLLLFVLVHIFQVFAAGFVREMRSMITGWYHAPKDHE